MASVVTTKPPHPRGGCDVGALVILAFYLCDRRDVPPTGWCVCIIHQSHYNPSPSPETLNTPPEAVNPPPEAVNPPLIRVVCSTAWCAGWRPTLQIHPLRLRIPPLRL
eukprot:2308203-Pyramimonas_sp.AAC.1